MVEQKESKDYSYQENILELILECLERGVVPTPEVRELYEINIHFLIHFTFQYPIDQEAIRKRKDMFQKVTFISYEIIF